MFDSPEANAEDDLNARLENGEITFAEYEAAFAALPHLQEAAQ
jgi:hypothetical protein